MEIWNLVFMQDEVDDDAASSRELPNEEHRHRRQRSSAWPSCFRTWTRVRDRPAPAAARGRRVALGPTLRARRARRRLAQGDRRARPSDDVPDRRRRPAVERGPRLHPAPDAPPRRLARPAAGIEGEVMPPLVERTVELVRATRTPSSSRTAPSSSRSRARRRSRFAGTLRQGMTLFETEVEKAAGSERLPGDVVFKLSRHVRLPAGAHERARGGGRARDRRRRFDALMDEQRERAKRSAKKVRAEEELADRRRRGRHDRVRRVPDPRVRRPAARAARRRGTGARASEGEEVRFVLDRTPFYAESGGQVGDRGADPDARRDDRA